MKFRRSLWYFIQNAEGIEEAKVSMDEFMLKYNCRKDPRNTHWFICPAEDFTVIMLTHPDVVVAVL